MVAMGMPDPPEKGDKSSSGDKALHSLVRVESLIQLGLLLPACVVIGWAIGLALDRWLNQHFPKLEHYATVKVMSLKRSY